MASYHMRPRDPLLESTLRASLERRGRELLGLVLLAGALALGMMLASYSPDDPTWLAATDAPAVNLMGRLGAAVAAALVLIAGYGAWALVVLLAGWGLRFALHQGQDRVLNRIIFAPIAVALAAIHAATLVPPGDWPHSFGLGGLFGDTVLGAVLSALPVQATFGLKVLSVLLAVALLGLGLYVLGFIGREVRAIGRFLLVGLVVVYAALVTGLARFSRGTVKVAGATSGLVAQGIAARRAAAAAAQDRRAASAAAMPRETAAPAIGAAAHAPRRTVVHGHPAALAAGAGTDRGDDPAASAVARAISVGPAPQRAPAPHPEAHVAPTAPAETVEARPRTGLLARLPGLIRPTASDATGPAAAASADATPEDRIRARIASAIKARSRAVPTLRLDPGHAAAAPASLPGLRTTTPPLTARHAAAAPAVAPAPVAPPAGRLHDDWGWNDDDDTDDIAGDIGEHDPFAVKGPADWSAASIQPVPVRPAPDVPRRVVQHAPRKPIQPSRRAQAETQPPLRFDEPEAPVHELPPLSLLAGADTVSRHQLSDEALEENARMLENVLDDYGVKGEIVSVRPGPVVTMYELEPAPGLKASRVIGLADDIARSMSALSARVSTVPGRSVIGIELPNAHREKVVLREILASRDFDDTNLRLPLALGKDIGGAPIVASLAKMPHLLIAGTTGSGKSVAINTMILSLLYKLTPEECRLIMIDPKMLELSVYDGIPHLLSPVVTDPKKAVVALKWVVGEMEDRYRKMSKMGVRNIDGYNGRVREALSRGEMFQRTVQTGFDDETGDPVFETEEFAPKALPFIVVIVDEMADLMMVAGKEIEACIQRLAQMARASGIHLIMATQRPSVDVITGTIKANFPTRISFQVTSKIDSRTILGEMGAEQLLGMGDMLHMAGGGRIRRIHGPFVSDEEVEEIVRHLKSFGPPAYVGGVLDGPDEDKEADIDLVLGLGSGDGGDDTLYDQAVAIVARDRKCSTSYIQRKLGIGYNKAARLVEQMEDQGVVTAANHVGKREVLVGEA